MENEDFENNEVVGHVRPGSSPGAKAARFGNH